jgi:hypothetical protein
MKLLIQNLRDAIAQNARSKAEALIITALDQYEAKAIDDIRKEGIFRFARYNFNADTLTAVVERARQHPFVNTTDTGRAYLDSVIALSKLAPAARLLLKRLQTETTPFFFKRYLVVVEALFRSPHRREPAPVRSQWQHFDTEELADGFSYYYSLLQEKQPLTIANVNHLPLSKTWRTHIERRLVDFARIIRFREAEILITSFPFVATTDGNVTTVKPVNSDFEKSIRWGYIRDADQRSADRLRSDEQVLPSLKDLAVSILDQLGDRLCQVVNYPSPRLRIALPLTTKLKELFAGNHLFREEQHLVLDTLKSLFIEFEKLESTPVYKSITLNHLLKFRRMCAFIWFVQDEFCRRHNLVGSPIYYRSLVTHLPIDEAFSIAREFCGVDHPEELYEVLSTSAGSGRVFDLQRTPILGVAGQYIVPNAVVANSNIMCNALQFTQFRFDASGTADPVSGALAAAFAEVGIRAVQRLRYEFNGKIGEIDVLALLEDHLFAFECKNSLSPCNPHELRQSYGYILKAFDQLTRLRDILSEPGFRTYLRKRTNFDITDPVKLTTCVATGNRMFNGYQNSGHSIRNVHELLNVIQGGTAYFSFPDKSDQVASPGVELSMPLIQGARITANEFAKYMVASPLHRLAFDAMAEHEELIGFGQKRLCFRTFALDLLAFRDSVTNYLTARPSSGPP